MHLMSERGQLRPTLLVMLVFALLVVAAMATQYARIRAHQVPTAASAPRR